LEPIYVELEAHMVVDHGKRLHAFCWIIIWRFVIKFYILLLGYVVHLESHWNMWKRTKIDNLATHYNLTHVQLHHHPHMYSLSMNILQ
jgi:hypothetical protein